MTRDFRLFLFAQSASTLGSTFTAVAVPLVAVLTLKATPAQVGLLVAAVSAPALVFGVLTAAWVDRMPRRRPLLIACDLVSALAVAGAAVALATGRMTVWGLLGLVLVLGLAGVVVENAYFVHLRSLVPLDELARARAWLQGGEQVGDVAGRIVAGPMIVIGAVVPFVIDVATYLVSAVCLSRIRTPEPRRTAEARPGLAAGLTVVRGDPFLRQLVPFVAGQQVVRGMTLAGLAPFALTVLHVPSAWYGSLFVLASVVGLAGTGVTAWLADRLGPQRLTVVSLIGVSATTAVLPLAAGPLPVAAALVAVGIALPAFFGAMANVGLTTIMTQTVPEDRLGRAGATLQTIAAAALIAGSLCGGALAERFGVRPMLWGAAALAPLLIVSLARGGALTHRQREFAA